MAAEMDVKIRDFQAKLTTRGWNINAEGIEECLQELRGQDKTIETIIKWAIDCDLKEIGSKILPEAIKRGQVQAVEGPLVLQIQKVRNISAPKANEESGAAPRLLKLQLSDGHTTCFALEHSFIQKLGLLTPPGTKIRLKGSVPIFYGFMLLEPRHVEVLGGKVEKLILKWETQKNVSQQRAKPGMANDDGPPLFIAFNPKTSNRCEKKTLTSELNNLTTQNSLSSQRNTSDQKNENKKAHAAFEQSRDQRIETAKRGNEKQTYSTKTEKNANRSFQVVGNQRGRPDLSSDKGQRQTERDVDIKLSRPKQEPFGHNQTNKYVRDTKFPDKSDGQKYEEKNMQGKRPGFHKGGRRDDDFNDDYPTSKPSEGTLWDFLETKLPSKSKETENVKQMTSAVHHSEKDRSRDSRQPDGQGDGQYRGERSNQQRNDKPTTSAGDKVETGGNQISRDNYRKNQGEKHQQYEPRDQLRNNKEVNKYRNKENDRCENQFRNQQKHDRQAKDRREKPGERSMHNQNNKQEQCPEKRNYDHNNKRNDTQPSTARIKQSKQPEIKHENQSSRNREGSGQQSNQTDGNYRKNYARYDKTNHGVNNTHNTSRSEYSAQNYRNNSEKQGRVGVGVGGEVEQNTQNYRERTGADSQNPQQSENQKVNKHHERTHKESKDISNREKEDAMEKRADNVSGKNASGDIKQTPKNKHWWKEGEDCMVFHPENAQYYLARIVKVEVRFRRCIVIFQDNGRQATINWSNLFPLDIQTNRDHSFQIQRSHFSYPSPAYIQRGPTQFSQTRLPLPGNYAAPDMMRQRSQRPTQEFYRPPRGAKE